MVAVPIHRCWW